MSRITSIRYLQCDAMIIKPRKHCKMKIITRVCINHFHFSLNIRESSISRQLQDSSQIILLRFRLELLCWDEGHPLRNLKAKIHCVQNIKDNAHLHYSTFSWSAHQYSKGSKCAILTMLMGSSFKPSDNHLYHHYPRHKVSGQFEIQKKGLPLYQHHRPPPPRIISATLQ